MENNDPFKEKTNFFIDMMRTLGNLYTRPSAIAPYTHSYRDLTIPAMCCTLIVTIFLLLYNYLPLFEEPIVTISIRQTIHGTSSYLQSHPLYSLLDQFWSIISFFVIGWATIIFLIHRRNEEEQVYMLGVTLIGFCVILLWIMLRYLVGLFLLKAGQVWKWPHYIVNYSFQGVPIQRTFLMGFLFPLLYLGPKVFKTIRVRGIVTIVLFTGLMGCTYTIFRHYVATPTAKAGPQIIRPINPDSGKLQAKHNISVVAVLPADKRDKVVKFYAKYTRRCYYLFGEITVANNTDHDLRLPYYKSLRLNFLVDSLVLRQSDMGRSEDFVFDMAKLKNKWSDGITVLRHKSKIVQLSGKLTHKTYDHLLRYMRHHKISTFKVNYILAMDDHHNTMDVKGTTYWSIRFTNHEVYGNASDD